MTDNDIEKRILEQVIKIIKSSEGIKIDVDMLSSGLLDSFGYISLLTALENEFNFEISPDEQFDVRLRKIPTLTEFVREKLDDN